MCKNKGNPCPGCKKHKTDDAVWTLFTDEERQALEAQARADAPVRTAAHP